MYIESVPVHLVDHPLVHDALASLRDKRTSPEHFRRAATRISVLLASQALCDLPTRDATVDTPLGPAPARRVAPDVVVVPVLRAGLGMLDAILELVPHARVGHIGLQRANARAVRMICIVAAPEGVALVEHHHPDVHIYTPVVDRGLNDQKYIVPGLGDFGDRLYGTA